MKDDNATANAFPDGGVTHANGQAEWGQPGLTKREYFAAMAMQGMLADPERSGGPSSYAIEAVQAADALLKELARGNSGDQS